LVIDDHEVVREGLVAALRADDRFDVVATAASAREALDAVVVHEPDVAIVDLRLPDASGDALCRRIRDRAPSTLVVVLSSYLTEESVRAAVEAGAQAYVTKAAGIAELRHVLVRLRDHGAATGAGSTSQIMERLERLVEQRKEDAPTAQQTRVLRLVSEGATYRQIARQIGISESTVRFHLQNLKLKLNASSVTELVATAAARGLLTPQLSGQEEE